MDTKNIEWFKMTLNQLNDQIFYTFLTYMEPLDHQAWIGIAYGPWAKKTMRK